MWAEVTVPYVDLIIANLPIRTPSPDDKTFQVLLHRSLGDEVKTARMASFYRVTPNGTYGDFSWAAAEGFRPISPGGYCADPP
jgi:hypothetical protein